MSFADQLSFEGQEITPSLNQLKQGNTYYNNNVTSQTQLGESSDGQFIYITGLLPLKNEVTINGYLKNTYITFPSLLKEQYRVESRMIIPTSSTFWRQDRACVSYQIDSLFSKRDYPFSTPNLWLNDEEIFKFAQYKDCQERQPFLSIILTSSMHSPYNKRIDTTTFNFPSNYSDELKNYLTALHYTDKQIGKYIQHLKNNDLYNNTMLVITSDHEAHSALLNLQPSQVGCSIKHAHFYALNK